MHETFEQVGWRSSEPPCLFTFPQHERKEPELRNPTQNLEEGTRVPAAYVLLNTEIGAGAEVVEALKKLEGVESAFNLWGVYDVIASVKAESMDGLSDIINRQIEKIEKIHSKLTMIISEKGVPSTDKLSRQLF
jgi:DNA-binding Lrp family transcriptional regulator